VVGGRVALPEKQAASTSEVGRFETEILSTKSNLLIGVLMLAFTYLHARG